MNKKINKITQAGLLIALAIVIPMFMPKFVMEPASFTLASHVPIFLAIFISPTVAISVALGSTAGFFFAGFPLTIVARAFSHIVFVLIASYYLKKNSTVLQKQTGKISFGIIIGIIHGAMEVVSVLPFYLVGNLGESYYNSGFFYSVIILVGVGTVIHSMVDYILAIAVCMPISRQLGIRDKFFKPKTQTT